MIEREDDPSEVKSGALVGPGIPDLAEHAYFGDLVTTYGKTLHTWQYDRGDFPYGIPQLMMGFTQDGQADEALIHGRDRRLGISTVRKRQNRADIPDPEVVPGANSWQSGRTCRHAWRRWTSSGRRSGSSKEIERAELLGLDLSAAGVHIRGSSTILAGSRYQARPAGQDWPTPAPGGRMRPAPPRGPAIGPAPLFSRRRPTGFRRPSEFPPECGRGAVRAARPAGPRGGPAPDAVHNVMR